MFRSLSGSSKFIMLGSCIHPLKKEGRFQGGIAMNNVYLNDILEEAIRNDNRFYGDEVAEEFFNDYDELAELACPEEWYDE